MTEKTARPAKAAKKPKSAGFKPRPKRQESRRAYEARMRHNAEVILSSGVVSSGTELDVEQDNGAVMRTKARSEPWRLGNGDYVVLLEGRTGGYLLGRCALVAKTEDK